MNSSVNPSTNTSLAHAAYDATARVASATYSGTVKGAEFYTAVGDKTYLVASSALEVANDIRKGAIYVFCNPKQCFKDIVYNVSGMNNFAEAASTIRRQPNRYLSDEGDSTVIKSKDLRTLLQRVGDATAQVGIGISKFVVSTGSSIGSAALYATNEGFRRGVNTTAGIIGSVALEGSNLVYSGGVRVLTAIGSASVKAVTNPQAAIQTAANYTTIVAGAAGALGMAYLSGKALLRANAERINGEGWGSRFKVGAYFLGSAASMAFAATFAAVSIQTYTK